MKPSVLFSALACAGLQGAAAAAAPSAEQLLHPELKAAAEQMKAMTGQMQLTAKALAPTRQFMAQMPSQALPAPPAAPVIQRLIPGPKGAPDVPITVIGETNAAAPRPALLYVHGGGFVLGSTNFEVRMLQETAAELGCVIISADYRLAPETRFPGPMEDNYTALRWLHDHADELGVDRRRIAVAGTSAGGGLAAMVALAARDRAEVPLVMQVLLEPMLDDRTGSTRQVPAHIGTIGWNADLNRLGWSSLLGVPAGSKHVPSGAVPARAPSLAGLPPTFIAVGSIDLFVNEDIEYAQRLIAAGVPTELLVVPGAFHGFEGSADTTPAKQYVSAWRGALRRAFASL